MFKLPALLFSSVVLAAAFPMTASALELPDGYQAAEQTIQAADMLADVSTIASDAFEGRGPGSEGDRKARAFLAGRLREMGFEPLFAGNSYEQNVDIVGLTVINPAEVVFSTAVVSTSEFVYGDEYMFMCGVQQRRISVADAVVVFVGY